MQISIKPVRLAWAGLLTLLSMPMVSEVQAQTITPAQVKPSQDQTHAKSRQNDPKIVAQIKGDFRLRAGSLNGVAMTSDHMANVSVKITELTITTYDGKRQQRFRAGYEITGDKQPWQVQLTSAKSVSRSDGSASQEQIERSEGILDVSADGARVRLAYATDSGQRPKDFQSGKNRNVFELERLPQPGKQ